MTSTLKPEDQTNLLSSAPQVILTWGIVLYQTLDLYIQSYVFRIPTHPYLQSHLQLLTPDITTQLHSEPSLMTPDLFSINCSELMEDA